MNGSPMAGAAIHALEARVQRCSSVPAGNVQVLRNVDHYFTGAIPLFRYA